MVLHHPDMIFNNFLSWIPESGFFSKSTYLKSACYGEFPNTKIFQDKFCRGSGFAPKRWFFNFLFFFGLLWSSIACSGLFRMHLPACMYTHVLIFLEGRAEGFQRQILTLTDFIFDKPLFSRSTKNFF